MGRPTFQNAVYFNLLLLKINAALFSFPISVDLKKSRILPNDSLVRRLCWYLGLGLLTFKMLYVVGTFAAASAIPELYNELHFPLHFVFMTGYLLSVPVGHAFFNVHRSSFILVWNTLLADLPEVEINNSPMQLQLALGLPLILTSGFAAASVMFALDHTWLQQLQFVTSAMHQRSYFEDECRYRASAAVTQLADTYALMMIPALAGCIAVSHMGALEVTNALGKRWIQDCKWAPSTLTCKRVRTLQLIVRHFNDCHNVTIFVDKLICLSTGTVGLSAILLANFVHPITSALTAYISVMCVTQFPTVYHKAYPIYQNMEDLKRLTLLNNRISKIRPFLTKMLRSVQNEGISVGDFGRFEQDAFLVYGSFIVNQVVSIIIGSRE